jgi:hypothetical protein
MVWGGGAERGDSTWTTGSARRFGQPKETKFWHRTGRESCQTPNPQSRLIRTLARSRAWWIECRTHRGAAEDAEKPEGIADRLRLPKRLLSRVARRSLRLRGEVLSDLVRGTSLMGKAYHMVVVNRPCASACRPSFHLPLDLRRGAPCNGPDNHGSAVPRAASTPRAHSPPASGTTPPTSRSTMNFVRIGAASISHARSPSADQRSSLNRQLAAQRGDPVVRIAQIARLRGAQRRVVLGVERRSPPACRGTPRASACRCSGREA